MAHVWIVEMWVTTPPLTPVRPEWAPCATAHLARDEGRAELREWQARNPGDRFRLVKYVRQDAP